METPFLTVLRLRSGCQHDRVLVSTLSQAVDCQSLSRELTRSSKLSGNSYKYTNHIPEGSTLRISVNPNYFPKSPPPIPSNWGGGVKVSTYEFEENINIWAMTSWQISSSRTQFLKFLKQKARKSDVCYSKKSTYVVRKAKP